MPGMAHLFYVPIVLVIGIAIGYVFGNRAARDAQAAQQRAEAAKAARHAARDTPLDSDKK